MNNIILVDCDGVLLNWQHAYNVFMVDKGYVIKDPDFRFSYSLKEYFGIDDRESEKRIVEFNNSAAIGFLPPLRDSIHYVKKLHEEHGFVFHAITSLGKNMYSQELRKKNLKKLFGSTVFEKFVFLDTGATKEEVLEPYKNSECYWIEDHYLNAKIGQELGLNSILMEHAYNMHHDDIPRVKNWKELYEMIV